MEPKTLRAENESGKNELPYEQEGVQARQFRQAYWGYVGC
jgi:hypothetical protein